MKSWKNEEILEEKQEKCSLTFLLSEPDLSLAKGVALRGTFSEKKKTQKHDCHTDWFELTTSSSVVFVLVKDH